MWEIKWCNRNENSETEKLLNDNWEPFGVSNDVIYFRRQKSLSTVRDISSEARDYLVKTGVIKGDVTSGE
jgi:hypothetical protein